MKCPVLRKTSAGWSTFGRLELIEISNCSQPQREIHLESSDGIIFCQPLKKKGFKFYIISGIILAY